MRRSNLSEEQVAYALRQAEAGTGVPDLCRQLGITEATFYVWRKTLRPPRRARGAARAAARGRKRALVSAARCGLAEPREPFRERTAPDLLPFGRALAP
jgi:transposase-like protein